MLEDKLSNITLKIIVPAVFGIGLAAGYISGCGGEEKSYCCQKLQCDENDDCDDKDLSWEEEYGVYCINDPNGSALECCKCYTPIPSEQPTCVGKGCL